MAGSKGSKYYNVFLNYELKLRDNEGNVILNHEGFELLTMIHSLNSIVSASNRMGISYRKAWGIINKVEKKLGFPLVIKQRGGADGGHTSLSPEGLQLLDGYNGLTEQFEVSVKDITQKFFQKINK